MLTKKNTPFEGGSFGREGRLGKARKGYRG